jgi:hypothetical protein
MSVLTKNSGFCLPVTIARRQRTPNWPGLRTVLLDAAESGGFELMITTDQEIPYQQNLGRREIAIIILCAAANRLADLKRLVPAALDAMDTITPGQVLRIE